ncbi:glycosyltransferase [Niabella sp. 3A5MI-3]|nr:glycosyltransferase family 2 protein [Niabella beijingensis]MBZ4189998.1 glycosyltransferase [Niabella beijingensis]
MNWNYSRYIPFFLECLSNQTDKNFRLLFCDNASTDDSIPVFESEISKYNFPRVLIRRTEPYGVSANLNHVLRNYPVAFYCMIISVDDWLKPMAIENRMGFFNKHADTDVLLSHPLFFFEDTTTYQETAFDQHLLTGDVFSRLILGNFLSAPGSVWRLSVLKDLDFFDENLAFEDWDMWLRCIKNKKKIRIADDQQVVYRRHGNSFSARLDLKNFYNYKQTLDKYDDHPNYRKSLNRRKIDTLYYLYTHLGDFSEKEAREYLKVLQAPSVAVILWRVKILLKLRLRKTTFKNIRTSLFAV